jgi:hypothetical protein
MEKVVTYTAIIKDILQYVGFLGKRPDDPIATQVIEDDQHGHYLLFSNGWRGERRTYGCYLHLDLTPEGKVWLQHDGTDLEVAMLLVEKGIPKQDIVLGFQPPIVRADTGFAVA